MRVGVVYFHVAIACLAGTPAAGSFVPTFSEENFNRLIIFTGIMLIASSLFMAGVSGINPPPETEEEVKEKREIKRKGGSLRSGEETVSPSK